MHDVIVSFWPWIVAYLGLGVPVAIYLIRIEHSVYAHLVGTVRDRWSVADGVQWGGEMLLLAIMFFLFHFAWPASLVGSIARRHQRQTSKEDR